MTHTLKIQRQWADAKLAGEKPFEIRINDRGFQKGDIVQYTVVDPKTGLPVDGSHPLEKMQFQITYVTEGRDGLEKGYCVFADIPYLPGNAPRPYWVPESNGASIELVSTGTEKEGELHGMENEDAHA